jgi:CDP-glucose 4,6-dehydratase
VARSGARVIDPAFWRNRRVLVTGSTGFKGAWLSLWLHRLGADVRGFAAAPPTEPSLYEAARLAELSPTTIGDVRDYAAVRDAVAAHRPEVVVHLAAQPLVKRSLKSPIETYSTNVLGTVHVLEALRTAGEEMRVLICVTSDKCYANREWVWGYRETDALGGVDPYSASKACQELVAASYRDSMFQGGVAVATARAGNVIGGGDWAENRLVPDLMAGALNGSPVTVRNPNSVRPWQHVLNPLCGYLCLAERLWRQPEEFAEAWNFSPDVAEAKPVGWVVERLTERWSGDLVVDVVPADDDSRDPIEARSVMLDASKARLRLDWEPRWSLAQALDAIVDWYEVYRAGGDVRTITSAQIAAFEQ